MGKRLQLDRIRLRHDLIAGLTVAAVAVPQAMAYAQIAGLPPQYGLYTAFVLTALGSLFGSSSHLISGPTNAISLVVFSALAVLEPSSAEVLTLPEKIQACACSLFWSARFKSSSPCSSSAT